MSARARNAGVGAASWLVAGLLLCGCAETITPRQVESAEASWDGNEQDSGLIGFAPSGQAILTAHAKDRYDALCEVYAQRFAPAIVRGEGVQATSTNTWLMDGQHLEYFATMNRWRKEGK